MVQYTVNSNARPIYTKYVVNKIRFMKEINKGCIKLIKTDSKE